MREQEKYWGFQAPLTPEFRDLPNGIFSGTEAEWNSLSPGYQREIYRSSIKKEAKKDQVLEDDRKRLDRADLKHSQGMKSILAREAL